MILEKEKALELIRNRGSLDSIPKKFWKDKEFVLEAVRIDGNALQYASDKLKNDREVVLEAVKEKVFALQFASDELKNDKEFVLEALKSNPYALEYVSLDFFKNEEQLAQCIEAVNNHLKDRVGQDVSQEDQEYASEVIGFVKYTVTKKRKEINTLEQEENAKAQRVKAYKAKIDQELGFDL